MSFTVPPVTTTDAVQPTAGSTQKVTDGGTYVVTDPATSGTAPATLEAPATGSFDLASGAVGSNVVVQGDGNATINIGNATTGGGGQLNASGSSFQVTDEYAAPVNANLSFAIVDGTNKVDTSSAAVGGGTIASNLPSDGNSDVSIDYYINAGAGNDVAVGSRGNDFLRLGVGDDTFDAADGNDIVRTGAGMTQARWGLHDTVYFTIDQLQGTQTKTITDFDAKGNDKIQIDADLEDLFQSMVRTNSITINLSGSQTGTTTVVSQGETIDDDDIEFV